MLLVVGALALWAVSPAVASAAPEWYSGGAKLGQSKEITWKGTVTLKYHVGNGFWAEFKCEDTGTGFAKPSGAGEETKWTFTNCQNLGPNTACENEIKLEAVKMPWTTKLVTIEGKIRNIIPFLQNASAAFSFSCKGVSGLGTPSGECKTWAWENEGKWYNLLTTMTNIVGGTVASEGTTKENCNGWAGEGGIVSSPQTIQLKTGALSVK